MCHHHLLINILDPSTNLKLELISDYTGKEPLIRLWQLKESYSKSYYLKKEGIEN